MNDDGRAHLMVGSREETREREMVRCVLFAALLKRVFFAPSFTSIFDTRREQVCTGNYNNNTPYCDAYTTHIHFH